MQDLSLEERILKETSRIRNDKKAVLKKWEMIQEAQQEIFEALGSTTCRYCKKYHGLPHCCKPCPVYKKTKKYICQDTPFPSIITRMPELLLHIKEEISFLTSLKENKK